LHIAAKRGEVNLVKYLLENGSNIDAKDRLNRDAYDLAVKNARHDVVKLLKYTKN